MKTLKQHLLHLYHELITPGVGGEAYMDAIQETLEENPECTDIFKDLFNHGASPAHKEILAYLILSVDHYEPAIKFLKTELGQTDFSGYKGFPEYAEGPDDKH